VRVDREVFAAMLLALSIMLKRSLHVALVALTVVAAACSGPSEDERKNDPNVDAEYKRNHRAEGYRKAQDSHPQPTVS
jgi:hypothetical protein